jgi:hypothetical protein
MNNNKITKNGSYQEIFGHFDFQPVYDFIADNLNNQDIFVEVGSAWGKSAVYMMEKFFNQNKKVNFYCVDIFSQGEEVDEIQFPFGNGKEYRSRMNNETLYYDFIYNINNSIAKDFKPIPIKTDSSMGANIFENLSCQAVFLDAAHDYDSVKKDLESWWPKIKFGGILAGHDFYGTENGHAEDNGVAKALKEFAKNQNFNINSLHGTTFIVKKI